MAIKVGGTTVVSDARELSNIASVDAATVTALSEAGVGGGGSVDFVASGAIANGDVVILKSNGTVGVVSETVSELNPVTLGTTTAFNSADTSWTSSVYDPDSQKIILAYRDNATSYPTAVVGTVSGTSISFGTPVVIQSVNSGKYMSVTYDTAADKPVFFFAKYFSGQKETGQAVVGTVSGTSISFGTVTDFENRSDPLVTDIDAAYDSGNSKHVIVWNNGVVTNRGSTAIVGTVSGTSISFGTPTIYNSASTSTQWVVYDANAGKVLVGYRVQDGANNTYVGTVSGTSISFGSPTSIATRTESTTGIYDPVSQKILVAYFDGSSGNQTGVTKVATISGTTVSYGNAVNFQNGDGGDYGEIAIAYSSVTGSFLISYCDFDASREIILRRGTISGTTASFQTAVQTGLLEAPSRMGLTYDTASGKFALLFGQDDAGDVGTGVVITETSVVTDAADYIGLAAEAISDTATGAVTIDGGVNEGQSGLTIGATYYVADNGDLQTTNNGRKIGRAISATEILVDSAMSGDEMNAYLGSLV
jgi:hypothetical protein